MPADIARFTIETMIDDNAPYDVGGVLIPRDADDCFDQLMTAGEMLLQQTARLGHFEVDGRPMTNIEMYALHLAKKHGESAVCQRWWDSLIAWLSTKGIEIDVDGTTN